MLVDIKASSFARHFENSILENIGQDLVSLMSDTLNALDLSYRERIFTPYVTLYAFLSQIFNEDSSCRRAVLEVANIRKARRQRQCSTSTGSFCKAKKRLPLILIEKLVKLDSPVLSDLYNWLFSK